MNAILTLSSILFPLITFPYVSRILLPEGTGKVAFATSLISYFALFSQLGIPTYGIRACARVRDDKQELTRTAQELLIINTAMSALAYIILFLALAFVPRLRQERTLYLVVSLTIIFNAIGMEWLYKGLEQYTYIAVRSVVFKFIALLGMFFLIRRQSDYVLYGGLTIFAASASNILNFFHARRYISLQPVGGYQFRRHFKAVAVFFAMSCAVSIYTHIDSTMLGLMIDDVAVGYYDAAVKVRTALLGIVTSLGTVLLPRTSYYIQHGKHLEFRQLSGKAMNFVILLAVPVMTFFLIFTQPCVYLLSGEAYHGAIMPLRLILPTVVLAGITNIWGIQMLVPMGREKVVFYSEVAGAVVDLTINALLIPSMGVNGAAIGTLIAETVVLLVQMIGLKNLSIETLRGIHYGKLTAVLLSAAAASSLILLLHWDSFTTLLLGGSLFFGLYFVGLLLAKEPLTTEMWKLLTNTFLRVLKRIPERND